MQTHNDTLICKYVGKNKSVTHLSSKQLLLLEYIHLKNTSNVYKLRYSSMLIDSPLSANGLHISYNKHCSYLWTITLCYTFSYYMNSPVVCYTHHCILVCIVWVYQSEMLGWAFYDVFSIFHHDQLLIPDLQQCHPFLIKNRITNMQS